MPVDEFAALPSRRHEKTHGHHKSTHEGRLKLQTGTVCPYCP